MAGMLAARPPFKPNLMWSGFDKASGTRRVDRGSLARGESKSSPINLDPGKHPGIKDAVLSISSKSGTLPKTLLSRLNSIRLGTFLLTRSARTLAMLAAKPRVRFRSSLENLKAEPR
jgi:hypothetical protein